MKKKLKTPDARRSADAEDELAISFHQFESVAKPARPFREGIARPVPDNVFRGRPYAVWKDDPELARMVNERLAPPL